MNSQKGLRVIGDDMKHKLMTVTILIMGMFAVPVRPAVASTWYVNGVTGSDSHDCKSATTACKTVGQAISLASSGDSVSVASATYRENLLIRFSLKVTGSGAGTTIIDGGGINCPAKLSFTSCTVITISPATTATVVLSGLTIRNGSPQHSMLGGGDGGGINNINGTLTINNSTVSGNVANGGCGFIRFPPQTICFGGAGGGISSSGTLTINNSTISGNAVTTPPGGITNCHVPQQCYPRGGGIVFSGTTLTISNSTVSGNISRSFGGGILTYNGAMTISNSTISGNSAGEGGGIQSYYGALTISSSTISVNSAGLGGGIAAVGGTVKIQNSILANSNAVGGNCSGTMTSDGYNLSSDGTCNFNKPGDLNNHDPRLGSLQNNGGPTPTMALPSGSLAIDGGNPGGCRDGQGNLLKTDQRGMPRPDPEDKGGCDIGAYERQSD